MSGKAIGRRTDAQLFFQFEPVPIFEAVQAGSGGRRPTLSEEGEEALTDMASLARASSEDFEAGGDDDDEALSEIEEFIRVAVLLLHGDVVLASRHRQRLN